MRACHCIASPTFSIPREPLAGVAVLGVVHQRVLVLLHRRRQVLGGQRWLLLGGPLCVKVCVCGGGKGSGTSINRRYLTTYDD